MHLCVEVRNNFVGSVPPLCELQGLSSGHQACVTSVLPTEHSPAAFERERVGVGKRRVGTILGIFQFGTIVFIIARGVELFVLLLDHILLITVELRHAPPCSKILAHLTCSPAQAACRPLSLQSYCKTCLSGRVTSMLRPFRIQQ